MNPRKAAILDVDGTLIDSNDQHAHAWSDALREAGRSVSYEQIRRLIGMGADRILPALIGIEEKSLEGQTISKRRGEIFRQKYLPTIKPFQGATELLIAMKIRGLKLSIGTSASVKDLSHMLKLLEAEQLIDAQATKADVETSKPDPEVVQVALRKLGFSANKVLMLGDTPYDIEAAASAGIQTVALRCGGWDDGSLSQAIAIYDDPKDLLVHFAASPFGLSASQ